MRKSVTCALFSFFLCTFSTFAQSNDLKIEVSKTINEQCVHKVKALTDHFAKIAKKEESDEIKDYHIEACLDLFIGRGEDTKDADGNVIFPAPRIEVSSIATGRVNSFFIKSYLQRLKGLQYSKIIFKTSKIYLAGDGIKKIGENLYSATVTFYQVFVGYKGDFIVYKDVTSKTVKVIIEKDNFGRFDVLLGDIKVDQTTAE